MTAVGRFGLHIFGQGHLSLDLHHRTIVIGGRGAVIQAGIDQRRIDGAMAEPWLNRRDLAAGIQQLHRARMAQLTGRHLDAHALTAGVDDLQVLGGSDHVDNK